MSLKVPLYPITEVQYDTRFHWKIENFSLQKGRLQSPRFYFMSSEWCVELLLRDMSASGNQIKIGFRQLTDQMIRGNWSLSLLNGSLLNLGKLNDGVNNGKSSEACIWILKFDDIFKSGINIPNDTLIILGQIEFFNKNYSRIFNWNLESYLQDLYIEFFKEQYVAVINKGFKIMNINMSPGQTFNYEETTLRDTVLKIKLHLESDRRLTVTLEVPTILPFHSKYYIYLSQQGGKYVLLEEDKFKKNNCTYVFYFNFDSYSDRFNLLFHGNYIETKYLNSMGKNPVSKSGIPQQTSKASKTFSSDTTHPLSDSNRSAVLHQTPGTSKKFSDTSTPLPIPSTLYEDFRSMYQEGFMSDFQLRTQLRTFQVHKTILGARSSVFRAMFTADMKEKDSGFVDIPDVDADTIQRMLKFVYCDEVDENMQWESACSLYSAADKYALESLKQTCSNHLMANLSTVSVIGVLLLSDTHQDQDLQAATVDFISRHDKEIIGTEMWKNFTEEHGPLSLEIIQLLYMKKMAA